MDDHDTGEPFSGLVISDEVLAAIAVTAAKDVDGVSALVPRADVTRLLRTGDSLRYVKIGGGEADILLHLAIRIRAGARISSVAGELQKEVKNAVQNMTGRAVAKVNVSIAGADF
ncbi:MAG: Asp23/Gls24 family envelope stress response protein [Oscillospiraceae bacterium]|jgi:uncharacterized alkaline shock family protein YloU|nr:Asp23/Gls24 family envelope stress response protein [Oscillospiraceae bacterium]